MTKKDFRELLVNIGEPLTITIVSKPDWNGGRFLVVYDGNYDLQDFEYTEWSGDINQAIKDRNIVFEETICHPHEETIKNIISLENLIKNYVKTL